MHGCVCACPTQGHPRVPYQQDWGVSARLSLSSSFPPFLAPPPILLKPALPLHNPWRLSLHHSLASSLSAPSQTLGVSHSIPLSLCVCFWVGRSGYQGTLGSKQAGS